LTAVGDAFDQSTCFVVAAQLKPMITVSRGIKLYYISKYHIEAGGLGLLVCIISRFQASSTPFVKNNAFEVKHVIESLEQLLSSMHHVENSQVIDPMAFNSQRQKNQLIIALVKSEE